MVIWLGDKLTYMTTLSERVLAALEAANMDQSDLSRRVGISSVAVNNWCTGATKSIKGENLLRAASALGVRPDWLAYGHGSMKSVDLGPAIQTPLRPVVVVDSSDDINPDHDIFTIPRYTVRASAGDGEPVFEIDTKGTPNYCRGGWALENGYKRDKLFSIVARGNSMEPTIPNGASLIVHRQEEVVSGKVHVICRGDECYVKRLIRQLDGSVLVKSENPDYKDVEVLPDDPTPLHVVGLVVSVSFNL